MFLTKEEERILDGDFGLSLQERLKILVALGDLKKAEKLIPINDVHVAGVSYKTIGDFGLEWLEHLNSIGAKKKNGLNATTNPAGMDTINFKRMGVDEDSHFYGKQTKILDCLVAMNLQPTWSCSAWLHRHLPYRTHVAFAESHLSCFTNSQGVRTNRESGPSALYGAVLGKTPYYGYHLDENRVPTITIELDGKFKQDSSASSALGYWIGRELRSEAAKGVVVPYIRGNVSWLSDFYLRESLAAGVASNSKINCFYIEGITKEPSEEKYQIPTEKLTFTEKDLKDIYNLLSDPIDDVDIIFTGCPHLNPFEAEELFLIFDKEHVKRCWSFTGRDVYETDSDYPELLYDTCLVVAPLNQMGFESIATNSAKAAHYIRTVHELKTILTDKEGLVKIAKFGEVPRIEKNPDMTLYKGTRESPKGSSYLCPNENKIFDLEVYGAGTESTAFGSVAYCPKCKGFAFKI